MSQHQIGHTPTAASRSDGILFKFAGSPPKSKNWPCRACLEYLRVEKKNPDIIHAHEWQLSAIPMLYW